MAANIPNGAIPARLSVASYIHDYVNDLQKKKIMQWHQNLKIVRTSPHHTAAAVFVTVALNSDLQRHLNKKVLSARTQRTG